MCLEWSDRRKAYLTLVRVSFVVRKRAPCTKGLEFRDKDKKKEKKKRERKKRYEWFSKAKFRGDVIQFASIVSGEGRVSKFYREVGTERGKCEEREEREKRARIDL